MDKRTWAPGGWCDEISSIIDGYQIIGSLNHEANRS
jgi:hypothetical protein